MSPRSRRPIRRAARSTCASRPSPTACSPSRPRCRVPRRPDVLATGISFVAPPGERHLGFGERSNAVDQRGREVENYVAEGPYQEVERPFISGFVPPPGYHPRDDATYFPIPWLLSTRGFGVLVTNDETSVFRLANDQPDAWSVEARRRELGLRVVAGPAAGRRRCAASARCRAPAAGRGAVLLRPVVAAEGRRGGQHRDAEGGGRDRLGRPDLHALPPVRRPGRAERARRGPTRFHAAGLAVTTYFNPMICTQYTAATRRRGSAVC